MMPHAIALVTDSTCDIPAEWVRQYQITVVPMTIIFGNQQYLDGVEMTAEEFYNRLPRESHHPTTSQVTPHQFAQAFRKAAESGAQEVLAITISSAMSGAMASAQEAAKSSPIPVHILDSKSNSMGLGWMLIAAARAREAGGGLDEMISAAKKAQQGMVYYISLDTIEFLSKGGRIAGAVKFLGSLIQIKPLIYVNRETGTVGASIPARSRKGALEGLYKEFFKHFTRGQALHITVLHNNALPEAQALAEKVQQEYAPVEMFITIVSPALGVHTGPGAVALCGYAE